MCKYFSRFFICALLFLVPLSGSYAGFGISGPQVPGNTDSATMQLVSYYDLRDRQSLVQVSNISNEDVAIHVQIFRNELEGCPEINFNDTLTPNDTHVYDLDNIVGNASPVSADLGEDSHGFVVITQVENAVLGSPAVDFQEASLIGNFRIIDAAGYEYRTNSTGFPPVNPMQDLPLSELQVRYTFNFNQLGANNLADIVGIQLFNAGPGPSSVIDGAVTFGAFVFNDAENGTSCDFVTFACGGFFGNFSPQAFNIAESDFLNYGINDIFPSTNGDNTICPGNQDTSGFVDLIGIGNVLQVIPIGGGRPFFAGFAGLNNGNGTGSMDSFVSNNVEICEFFPDNDCPFDIDF